MPGRNEIVQRWLALWNGNLHELDTLVADEIVVHAVLVGQITEGPLVGRDALRGWIATARAMLPMVCFSVEVGPLVDGNMIAVRWRAEGPHGSARISFTGIDILRIEGGRIAELWTNADTMLMMQQAGMLPSPSS